MLPKSLLVTGLLIALLLVGGVGYVVGTKSDPAGPSAADLDVDLEDTEDAEAALTPLIELYADLQQRAVDAPEEQALVEGAIEGMLDTLDDDYARYFPAEAFEAFQSEVSGEFVGVGVFLEETPEGVTVVSVIPDTPAESAGLEAGDRIVAVDGEDVRDEPINVITQRVQGEEGTDVELGIENEDGDTRQVSVTRARIDIPTVDIEVEDGIAVVRMIQFTSATGDEFGAELESLVEREPVEGILLDLRGNGGGPLNDAVEVADALMGAGPVVSVVEADGRERELDSSDGGLTDLPLVVLVNEGSASATEILAGALQQRGRAELVGTETFGKGTVQTIRQFENGSGVKFTTAEYFLPEGNSVEGEGITPDEVVEDPDEQLDVARRLLEQKVAAERSDGD